MKSVAEWSFSAARVYVDLPRIIRETEDAATKVYGRAPAVVRVKVDKEVYTLAHESVMTGFAANGCPEDLKRFLDPKGKDRWPFIGVREGTKFVKVNGTTGVSDPTGEANLPAEWTLINGDWVKELTDRVQVRVEAF